MMKVYYDADLDLRPLDDCPIAIIGYGAQGRAHALNLRDSGCQVLVGQRDGRGRRQAEADGFEPQSMAEAAAAGRLICLMLPDEVHGQVFDEVIAPHLQPDDALLCCHGFSLHYGLVQPPAGVAALLVAPKGAGHRVRSAYEAGSGVPCYVALGSGTDEQAWPLALAYAKAIGGGRVGVMKTTIREETETDLFGEQVVLCGGISHLMLAAFETLTDAGYSPEMAYFECVHELKLVVDLLHRGGLAYMHDHISNTAEYGDYTRGPRIVDDQVRGHMKEILAEIQSGEFAREWIQESGSGGQRFAQLRRRLQQSEIERTGQRVQQIISGKPVEETSR